MAVAEGDRKRQRPVRTEVQDRSKAPRASKGPRGQSSGDGRKRFRKNSSLTNEVEEIALLDERIAAGAPPPGSNPLAADLVSAANAKPRGAKDDTGPKPYAGVKRFDELPISDRTKRGLKVRPHFLLERAPLLLPYRSKYLIRHVPVFVAPSAFRACQHLDSFTLSHVHPYLYTDLYLE